MEAEAFPMEIFEKEAEMVRMKGTVDTEEREEGIDMMIGGGDKVIVQHEG